MRFFHYLTIISLTLGTLVSCQVLPYNKIDILPVGSNYLSSTNEAINNAITIGVSQLYFFLKHNFYCRSNTYNYETGMYGCPSAHVRLYTPIPSRYSDTSSMPDNAKYQLYQKIQNVVNLLGMLKKAMIMEGEKIYVKGNNNNAAGSQLVVIGSNKKVQGKNAWIFTSNPNSYEITSGQILIDNYIFSIEEVTNILTDPYSVIKCITSKDSQMAYKNVWNTANPFSRLTFD